MSGMSQASTVFCPACGAENEVLVPDDSFSEQQTYSSFQFSCRACGAALQPKAAPNDGNQGSSRGN
jgi:hypothetical protein